MSFSDCGGPIAWYPVHEQQKCRDLIFHLNGDVFPSGNVSSGTNSHWKCLLRPSGLCYIYQEMTYGSNAWDLCCPFKLGQHAAIDRLGCTMLLPKWPHMGTQTSLRAQGQSTYRLLWLYFGLVITAHRLFQLYQNTKDTIEFLQFLSSLIPFLLCENLSLKFSAKAWTKSRRAFVCSCLSS